MRRVPTLRAEELEPRDTPAAFGTPWPDGQHLTLSFAPDATAIGGRASDLAALFARLGPAAKYDVLRAFQTWAVYAGLNVGLVGDTGARFGAGGPVQGDPRFGDIRLGGIRLARDVYAVTAPYNVHDNYSGNVVVNTAARFGPGGADLFTVMLQEAGHAFGVGNSPDTSSAMYEYYLGQRAGLSAADVAAIRALYGARAADRYEGPSGNDTLASATRYWDPVTGDLASAGDVDVYKFTAGLLTRSVTVNLRAAGLSLVTARVELLDSAGEVVASAAVTDPTANDITLSLPSVRAGATYYVRVSAARGDCFGAGSYGLEVRQSSILSDVTGVVDSLLDDTGVNDTLLSATRLLTDVTAVGPRTEYAASGSFGSRSDVDYYRISVPWSPTGGPVNLLTTVWGKDGAAVDAWVEAYDLFGNRLDAEVITADGYTTTVQVRGLTPGAEYFVRLASDAGAVGGYQLAADLRPDAVEVQTPGSGTLTASSPAQAATFDLAQTGQVHFVLSAAGASGSVELVVIASDGTVAARVTTASGRGRSVDVFLRAGKYRVEVRGANLAGPVAFKLGVAVVTDPTGAQSEDPTSNPEPSGTSPGSSGPSTTSGDNQPYVYREQQASEPTDGAVWY